MVRLSINVSPEVATTLQEYATRQGVTVTEAVRRAVSVLAYIDRVHQRGASVNVCEPDGKITEVVFMA